MSSHQRYRRKDGRKRRVEIRIHELTTKLCNTPPSEWVRCPRCRQNHLSFNTETGCLECDHDCKFKIGVEKFSPVFSLCFFIKSCSLFLHSGETRIVTDLFPLFLFNPAIYTIHLYINLTLWHHRKNPFYYVKSHFSKGNKHKSVGYPH